MHNGGIADFHLVKRRLQAKLSDEIFDIVQGNTGIPPGITGMGNMFANQI